MLGDSTRLGGIPAADDRRRSETDNRPMLGPRGGHGEAALVLTPAVAVAGDAGGILRRGREDEVEEDRDGGSEFRSGAMVKDIHVVDTVAKSQTLRSSTAHLRITTGHGSRAGTTRGLLNHPVMTSREHGRSQTALCLRHQAHNRLTN